MVSTMSKTPLTKGDKNRIRKRADVDVNFTYFQEVQVQLIPPGTTTPIDPVGADCQAGQG